MVRANSDTDREPKPPWRERKEAYIASVATKEPGAVRVSIADKLHNARMIVFDHRLCGDELWQRFSTKSGDDALWYYESLLAAFEARRDTLGPGTARRSTSSREPSPRSAPWSRAEAAGLRVLPARCANASSTSSSTEGADLGHAFNVPPADPHIEPAKLACSA